MLYGPTWLAWGLFAGIMDLYTGVSTGSITHSAIHLPVGKSYCLKCASLDGVAHRWSGLIQIISILWSHLAPHSWAAANLVCSQVLSSNFASFAPPSSASLAASANRWGWRSPGRSLKGMPFVAHDLRQADLIDMCVVWICTSLQNFQLFFHYVLQQENRGVEPDATTAFGILAVALWGSQCDLTLECLGLVGFAKGLAIGAMMTQWFSVMGSMFVHILRLVLDDVQMDDLREIYIFPFWWDRLLSFWNIEVWLTSQSWDPFSSPCAQR